MKLRNYKLLLTLATFALACSTTSHTASLAQEGGLIQNEIADVIESNIGQVKTCYETALQSQPKMEGRVFIFFEIAKNGSVHTAKISNSSLRSPSVESCIVQRLKTWKFPEPRGGVSVRVTYPFTLRRVS